MSQRLEDRIRQHVPSNFVRSLNNIRKQLERVCNQKSQLVAPEYASLGSAIAENIAQSRECCADFSTRRFATLSRARNSLNLYVLEAPLIRKLRPQLCKQKRIIVQNPTAIWRAALWFIKLHTEHPYNSDLGKEHA